MAENYALNLYPEDPLKRITVDQWFIYGSAQWTTLAQQYGLFMHRLGEDVPRAQEHYDGVLRDMMSMYENHLGENEYIAGEYSIADITAQVSIDFAQKAGIPIPEDKKNILRWYSNVNSRESAIS